MSDTPGPLTVKPGLGHDGSHSKPRPYCWLGKRQIVPPERWSGCDTATAWLEGFAAGVKQSGAADLLAACEGLMQLIEDGVLVRNIEGDGDPSWVLAGVRLVKTLQESQAAIAKVEAVQS